MAYLLASCNQSPQFEIIIDNPYAPKDGDDDMTRAPAFVEKADWDAAENRLHLAGSLPTPCNQLRVSHTQSGGRLKFEVYSLTEPGMMCAQMLQPFDVYLTVKNLPAQGLAIQVNGAEVFSP